MEIHILDWIIYFVLIFLINKFLPEDFTEELGAVVGLLINIIFTIAYIAFFSSHDWVDLLAKFDIKF